MDDLPAADELTLAELLGWSEFCAWTALVIAPIIYWLQGESVSHDQFVVRTGLVALSAAGAIGLRGWAWLRGKRAVEGDAGQQGVRIGSQSTPFSETIARGREE
jgi:hypothetical protein